MAMSEPVVWLVGSGGAMGFVGVSWGSLGC